MKLSLRNRIYWDHHNESVRKFFKDYYECHLSLRYP